MVCLFFRPIGIRIRIMVSEIFQKPKTIIGKVPLLPLPGSPCWNGDWELLMTRAEQEATTLASAGVDALLIENTNDVPYQSGRLDVTAAIAMGIITTTIQQYTQLPVGISVLLNDPETALAIALNTQASFVRLPVLSGARLTESGLINSRLNALLQYQNRLHAQLPFLLADIGHASQFLSPSSQGSDLLLPVSIPALKGMLDQLPPSIRNAIAFVISDRDISPEFFEDVTAALPVPLVLENHHVAVTDLKTYYHSADSVILEAGTRKQRSSVPNTPPSTDMYLVESIINTLRDVQSVSEMPPDVFLNQND